MTAREQPTHQSSFAEKVVTDIGLLKTSASRRGDLVVRKSRFGAFTAIELKLLLRRLGRGTVVSAGVSTNPCVDRTAREAFAREFFVNFASDACASWDGTLQEAARSQQLRSRSPR